MREVKRQKEKGKGAGDELRKRTLISLVKIREIRVVNPVFKIKKPFQNVRKIGKVKQGEARVFSSKKFAIFFTAHSSKN